MRSGRRDKGVPICAASAGGSSFETCPPDRPGQGLEHDVRMLVFPDFGPLGLGINGCRIGAAGAHASRKLMALPFEVLYKDAGRNSDQKNDSQNDPFQNRHEKCPLSALWIYHSRFQGHFQSFPEAIPLLASCLLAAQHGFRISSQLVHTVNVAGALLDHPLDIVRERHKIGLGGFARA